MTTEQPPLVRGRRGVPWLWVVAVAALAVALGLFLFGNRSADGDAGGDHQVTIADPEGDVVGAAVATVGPLLDLRGVELERRDGDLVVTFEHVQALDPSAAGDEPLTYAVTFRSGNVTYELRASVVADRAEATVTDLAALDRPFALPAPVVEGRSVQIEVPAAAVPDLADRFSWGTAVRVAASEDVAPSSRAELFPPLDGQGSDDGGRS